MTARDIRAIERSLAYSAAVSDIECCCTPHGIDMERWNTSDFSDCFVLGNRTPDQHAEIRETVDTAVAYLESRGLIERDAENPAMISIRDEAEGSDEAVLDLGPWPFGKMLTTLGEAMAP